MTRLLLGAVLVLCSVSPCPAAETLTSDELLIQLNVDPAAAPKPALRWLLLPELNEMHPGNPIPKYLEALLKDPQFFMEADNRFQLTTIPLRELPASELVNYGGAALRHVDWAARLDKPDWQILLKKGDGYNLLIPDVQKMRSLANVLPVRFRAEIALRRYDDAMRTAKTMFALARHMNEHPSVISHLVGIAIATIALGPLHEMLEQPGSPNLYWALTNLPSPLVSMRLGFEGERMFARAEVQGLDNSAPMTKEQLDKLIAHLEPLFAQQSVANKGNAKVRAWLDAHADESFVDAARRRLIDTGFPADRVNRFPTDQVLLLDDWRQHEIDRDETFKLMNLPAWQIYALGIHDDKPQKEALFNELLPAAMKVHMAQTRLDQRIALLRQVESLRMYAAEHNGTWPTSLAGITVPLPVDPVTGKPFRYELKGTTAHVRGTPPPTMKHPVYNVHYELTLRAK